MTSNPFRCWVEGEEWRPIPGMPHYEVSSIGRVRSLRTRAPHNLSLGLSHCGYLFAVLPCEGKQRTFYVSRLVCEAWHGPAPTAEHQAAHLDGDTLNNSPENLTWATPAENNGHKYAHKTMPLGAAVASSKLSDDDTLSIVRRNRAGESCNRLAAEYGVGRRTIQDIVNGTTWSWLTGISQQGGRVAQEAPASNSND